VERSIAERRRAEQPDVIAVRDHGEQRRGERVLVTAPQRGHISACCPETTVGRSTVMSMEQFDVLQHGAGDGDLSVVWTRRVQPDRQGADRQREPDQVVDEDLGDAFGDARVWAAITFRAIR
jgi:hypothetical protein